MKKLGRTAGRLNRILFRNSIAMLIPAVCVLLVVLTITIRYPIIYRMTSHHVESLDEIKGWYQNGCCNVIMDVPVLKYTGYDYYEDGKVTGAYYYTFQEGECVFCLIKTHKPEPILKNERVKGTILGESATLEAMKNEFAKEMNLDYDALNQLVYPLMLSEIDYPYLEVFLVWLLLIIPYGISVLMIGLIIYWTIRPDTHPSVRSLKEFGDRRLVYEEIRSQLANRLLQHNYNYYITDEYLIIHNWQTTDFIRIDYIRYISKHVVSKQRGKKQVYRLTMSNPEKMFYERNFHSEACVDEIMEALVSMNPMIDKRLIKIFDLKENQEDGNEKPEGEAAGKEPTAAESKPQEEEPTEAEGKPQGKAPTATEGEPKRKELTATEGKPQEKKLTAAEGEPQEEEPQAAEEKTDKSE